MPNLLMCFFSLLVFAFLYKKGYKKMSMIWVFMIGYFVCMYLHDLAP